MKKQKIIHDAIYGSIKLDDEVSDLISAKEFQKLNSVKQLGFSYLVFPGATHSRFEHSLGTHYLAGEAARNVDMDDDAISAVSLAGLLHDIGHGPFSHTLEDSMVKLFRKDHLQLSIDIISGKIGSGEISEILGDERKKIISILQGKGGIMSRLISGNGDMDQIDYLARDSYYTGVALGMVDSSRLLNTITIEDGTFCVMEKGLPAMEGLMVARMLMYRSVYRHRTSLVASVLANDALETLSPSLEEFIEWNDCDFIGELKNNENTIKTYEMLKFRKLPSGLTLDVDENQFQDIAQDLDGQVITSKYFKSPYKKEVINILDQDGLRPITEISGIMEYLEKELHGLGLLVFNRNDGERIKEYLKSKGIKYQ